MVQLLRFTFMACVALVIAAVTPAVADEYVTNFGPVEPNEPILASVEDVLRDLGPGLTMDYLWFNLNRGANKLGKPYVDPEKLALFEKSEFHRAVSYALDRSGMTRSILLGLGEKITKAGLQCGFHNHHGEFQKIGDDLYNSNFTDMAARRELLVKAYQKLQEAPPPEETELPMPVYKPKEDPREFSVAREGSNEWRISGTAIERAASSCFLRLAWRRNIFEAATGSLSYRASSSSSV